MYGKAVALETAPERTEIKVLMRSMREHGMVNPLIVAQVDSKYFVCVGNQRLAIVRRLGWTDPLPCRVTTRMDDKGKHVLAVHPYETVY